MAFVTGLGLVFSGSAHAVDRYVWQEAATPVHPYTNGWDKAADNIQDAVNVAAEGDTIWIRPGTYVATATPTNYAGFDNVVYLHKKLLNLRATNDVPGRVLIDGQGVNRGIAVNRDVTTTATLLLEGLTISNCVLSAAVGEDALGGGIYLTFPANYAAWDATLRDCVITHNYAFAQDITKAAKGGGLHASGNASALNLTVTNCVFSDNAATNLVSGSSGTSIGAGGALYLRSTGSILLTHCVFERNHASEIGGATLIEAAGGTTNHLIQYCTYRDNRTNRYKNAGSGGGGANGPGIYRNCLFVGNHAAPGALGGGIFCGLTGPLYVESCTIISNTASSGGGGVHIRAKTTEPTQILLITNSIFSHNGPISEFGQTGPHTNYVSHTRSGSFSSFIFEGTNNITAEPKFMDVAAGDFRLRGDSPCINAGANQAWMDGRAEDLAGNPRIDHFVGTVDMGCYEYISHGTVILIR